ncbi:Nmad2 family putative nucleotide modification protein [Pseudomonas lini]
MNIFSYVVARDFGFAPNPFGGYCTLATCKPPIRESAEVGDIIVGTRASPRANEIVYFMEVSEISNFQQYWEDPRFHIKRPNMHGSKKQAFGDNIYHFVDDTLIQEDSHHTFNDGSPCHENIETDLKSRNVLIAKRYAYWGQSSLTIPLELSDIVKKGPGFKRHFSEAFKTDIKNWLFSLDQGYFGPPISW